MASLQTVVGAQVSFEVTLSLQPRDGIEKTASSGAAGGNFRFKVFYCQPPQVFVIATGASKQGDDDSEMDWTASSSVSTQPPDQDGNTPMEVD